MRTIVTITANDDWTLDLIFSDGVERHFDVEPLLTCVAFQPLRDINLFKAFNNRGYFIEWECGADLSADTLYLTTETDEPSCRYSFIDSVERGMEDDMDYQQALELLWKVGQGGRSKSSGERVAAGILLGLCHGDRYPFRLYDIGNLDSMYRQALIVLIASWPQEIQLDLIKKYGQTAWNKFIEENNYRLRE